MHKQYKSTGLVQLRRTVITPFEPKPDSRIFDMCRRDFGQDKGTTAQQLPSDLFGWANALLSVSSFCSSAFI